jgi:hypothetical protein
MFFLTFFRSKLTLIAEQKSWEHEEINEQVRVGVSLCHNNMEQ